MYAGAVNFFTSWCGRGSVDDEDEFQSIGQARRGQMETKMRAESNFCADLANKVMAFANEHKLEILFVTSVGCCILSGPLAAPYAASKMLIAKDFAVFIIARTFVQLVIVMDSIRGSHTIPKFSSRAEKIYKIALLAGIASLIIKPQLALGMGIIFSALTTASLIYRVCGLGPNKQRA